MTKFNSGCQFCVMAELFGRRTCNNEISSTSPAVTDKCGFFFLGSYWSSTALVNKGLSFLKTLCCSVSGEGDSEARKLGMIVLIISLAMKSSQRREVVISNNQINYILSKSYFTVLNIQQAFVILSIKNVTRTTTKLIYKINQ